MSTEITEEEVATAAQQPTASPAAAPYRLPPLGKPKKQRKIGPNEALRLVVRGITSALPRLAAAGDWARLARAELLLLQLLRRDPEAVMPHIGNGGTSKLKGVIQQAVRAGAPAVQAAEAGVQLLLELVLTTEGAADLVVESEFIRLLLQLLQEGSPLTKLHSAEILHALAASKIVYKDVLHGAGIMYAITANLEDAGALCDLDLLQELLWTLISLADDDVVYKEHMCEVGTLKLLVTLLGVYQAHAARSELRPIAALALRCLHLLCVDDDKVKEEVRRLGLLARLADQLRLDLHAADEPPAGHAQAAAAFAASGAAHHHHHPSRLSSGGRSQHGARRQTEVPIPEEEELDEQQLDNDEPATRERSSTIAVLRSDSMPAPADGAFSIVRGGPTPSQRCCAAALLRALLQHNAAAKGSEGGSAGGQDAAAAGSVAGLLVHGVVLPALEMRGVRGTRLSLAREVASTLRVLLVDSPANQRAAYEAETLPMLVKLLSARHVGIACHAAEAITHMGQHQGELMATGAIEGLVELLRFAAAHAQEVQSSSSMHRSGSQHGGGGGGPAAAVARAAEHQLASPREHVRKGSGGGLVSLAHMITRSGSANSLSDISIASPRGGGSRLAPGGSERSHATGAAAWAAPGELKRAVSVGAYGRQQRAQAGSMGGANCLVGSHEQGGGWCEYCPLSAALKALLRVMAPEPAAQARFTDAGGVSVLVNLLAREVGQARWRLLAAVVSLLGVVLERNTKAQDELRFSGGIELLASELAHLVRPGVSDPLQLRVTLLTALTRALDGNPANKLALREQGGFGPMLALLRLVASPSGPRDVDDGEQLDAAVVELLCTCLPDSPGNQVVLHGLDATTELIELFLGASSSAAIRLQSLRALSLLADGYGACQAAVTRANVLPKALELAEQAGPPAAQRVCLEALAKLLWGNPSGREQAIELGVLPLAVRLLQQHPPESPHGVGDAAARLLGMTSVHSTQTQTEAAHEGAIEVLLERLDASCRAGEGQAAPSARAATTRVECLHAFCCIVQGNTFTKNAARQQGAPRLLSSVLEQHGALLLRQAQEEQQQQRQQGRQEALALQVLTAAALAAADLCQSNHANQDAYAAEGLLDQLSSLLGAAVGESLQQTAPRRALLAALARALGNAGEFHNNNKILIREAGGVGALARLILQAAEAPDLGALAQLRLLPALSAAAASVAVLAQDDEENQRLLLAQQGVAGQQEFVPALVRLMGVGEPMLATQAARALEFIAIRCDLQDDAEERAEFESDTIQALVRLLTRGATAGSSATAGAPPTATAVREASTLLAQLVAISSDLAAGGTGAGAADAAAGGSKGSTPGPSRSSSRRLGAADVGGAQQQAQQKQQQANGRQAQHGQATSGSAASGAAADDGLRPQALLPALVMDHSQGLAVLKAFPGAEEHGEAWQGLVGRSAPAFSRVADCVAEGAWRPFKLQVAWMLFLLAAKSPANCELIAKLERTSVTPMAQQLENAERYQAVLQQQEAQEAAAQEAAEQQAAKQQQKQQQQQRQQSGAEAQAPDAAQAAAVAVANGAAEVGRTGSVGGALPVSSSAARVVGGVGATSISSSRGMSATDDGALTALGPGEEVAGGLGLNSGGTMDGEDEWAMLQQEVAMLSGSLPASRATSKAGSGGNMAEVLRGGALMHPAAAGAGAEEPHVQ